MVAHQALPTVRDVAKERIIRAAVNAATDFYMGPITMKQMTVRCLVPKLSIQNKLMLTEKKISTRKINMTIPVTHTSISQTTTVGRRNK